MNPKHCTSVVAVVFTFSFFLSTAMACGAFVKWSDIKPVEQISGLFRRTAAHTPELMLCEA